MPDRAGRDFGQVAMAGAIHRDHLFGCILRPELAGGLVEGAIVAA